jgi:hypothetical protein
MDFKNVKNVLVFLVFFSLSCGVFGQESQSKFAVGVSYGFAMNF